MIKKGEGHERRMNKKGERHERRKNEKEALVIFSPQVESKYQKMLGTSYWQFQQARMNFWLQCNQSFVDDGVSPEMAAEFMEVRK